MISNLKNVFAVVLTLLAPQAALAHGQWHGGNAGFQHNNMNMHHHVAGHNFGGFGGYGWQHRHGGGFQHFSRWRPVVVINNTIVDDSDADDDVEEVVAKPVVVQVAPKPAAEVVDVNKPHNTGVVNYTWN